MIPTPEVSTANNNLENEDTVILDDLNSASFSALPEHDDAVSSSSSPEHGDDESQPIKSSNAPIQKRQVHFSGQEDDEEGFNTTATVHSYEGISDEEEKQSYWLSADELRASAMEWKTMIDRLKQGNEKLDEDFCLRGIEHYYNQEQKPEGPEADGDGDDYYQDILTLRKSMYEEIFQLQAMFANPEPLIADVSERASEKQRKRARELAIADEEWLAKNL